MLVQPAWRALILSLQTKTKLRKCRDGAMTNTSERVTTGVFGLSLTAVFLGLLLLNALSF